MKDWGFCGPTFKGYSKAAMVEDCINLLPMKSKKTPYLLMNAPGKRVFATLPDGPGRGIFAQDGRCFAVGGSTLAEISANGTVTPRGLVTPSGNPASFASNGDRGHQLAVVSGGNGSILDLTTNTLTPITASGFPAGTVIRVDYLDGYFIATTPDRFAISGLVDGLTWGADAGQRAGASDAIIGSLVDHEILWLFGSLRTEPWFDSGAASFPFEPVPSGFIETGLAAPFAVSRVGDSIMWLVQNERGGRFVVRNQGYNPVRVSTDAIDAFLMQCVSVADARSYSWELLGHTCWILTIPSADLTLLYDTIEDLWTRLGYWNTNAGRWEADRAIDHATAFGKHLVLDRERGTVWELSLDVYTDGADPRRWQRTAPHLAKEQTQIFYGRAELDAEFGVGDAGADDETASSTLVLDYSDDGGYTFGNELTRTLGSLGKYGHRTAWDGLGASRNRVFRLTGAAACKTVLNDLYLTAMPGTH